MDVERRKFLLAGLAAAAGATTAGASAIARTLAPGVAKGKAATTAVVGTAAGAYGIGARKQVFEVIVRQALAGAPWKGICKGPMVVNQITEQEIEAEVELRLKCMGPHSQHGKLHVSERLYCEDCRRELKSSAENEHPNHADDQLQYVCRFCRVERDQWAQEKLNQRRDHGDRHRDYVEACDHCWTEYRSGKKLHPQLGMREVKSSKT